MKRRTFLTSCVVGGVSMAVSPGSLGASSEMKRSLQRIHSWLKANSPGILDALRPPAKSKELAILKHASAHELPADLISLYEWHDGIDSTKIANFFFGFVFESANDVVSRMQRFPGSSALKYADPGIDPSRSLTPSRIPIGNDSARCFLCVDLAPTKEGSVGQIILIDDEYSVALKLSSSVGELVSNFASDLEGGKYSLQEDALEDGVEWLSPERSIDPINWFNSPTWSRAHPFAGRR